MRMSRTPFTRKALDEIARAAQGRVEEVAAEVAEQARRTAPRLTGALAESLTVVRVMGADGRPEFRVGWGPEIDYGPAVEFGTVDTPAQPHLRPAADAIRRRIGG